MHRLDCLLLNTPTHRFMILISRYLECRKRLWILLIHWTILHTGVQFFIRSIIIGYIILHLKSSSTTFVCVVRTTISICDFYKVYTYDSSTNMYIYLQIHTKFHHPNLFYIPILLLCHSSYSSSVFVLFLFHMIKI